MCWGQGSIDAKHRSSSRLQFFFRKCAFSGDITQLEELIGILMCNIRLHENLAMTPSSIHARQAIKLFGHLAREM